MIAAVEPGNFESLRVFLQAAGLPKAEVSELETAIKREPGVRSVEAGRETARWWTKISSGIKTGMILLARTVSEELLKQGIDTFFMR